MSIRFAAASIAAALAIGLAASAQAQSENQARAYDVTALTASMQDWIGPALGLDEPSGAGGGGTITVGAVADDGTITIDGIQTLIQENIEPGSWEGERRVSARGTTLIVVAPAETHAKIAALLAWLRAKHARPIVLELSVYQAPAAHLDGVLAGGSVLDEPRSAALEKAPWTRVLATRFVAGPNQRVCSAQTSSHSYLRDFDVEVADSAHGFDVEIGTLRLGRVDELRAVRSDGGHGLCIEVRHTHCDAKLPLPTFATGLLSITGKPLQPLDLPVENMRRVRNSLWMPMGGRAIAAAGRFGEDGRVLVVRHLDAPAEKLEPARGDGKRMMRIYDMRYALFSPNDFKGRLLVEPTSHMSVGGAIFDTGEEGAYLTSDALVEMIKSDVDEDSWHNDRNRVATMAGQLIVTQTPETMAKLETYLNQLERLRSVSLLVRSRVIHATDRDAENALTELVGGPLSAEGRTALGARVAEARGVAVQSDLATAALPGQRVHVGVYDSTTYLKDYDIEIATKTTQGDPEIALVQAGTMLDVRPILMQAQNQVMMELRLGHVALRSLDVRELHDGIKVQLPAVDTYSRSATVMVPDGGSILVDLGGGRFAQLEVTVSREKRD